MVSPFRYLVAFFARRSGAKHLTVALPLTVVTVALLSVLGAPAIASADYSSTVLADNPLVYYHLDETSGTSALDASPNAVNGVYSNTAGSLTGVTFGAPGPFSGGGAAVNLAASGTISASLSPSAASAEFWVDPSARASQTFLQHGDPTSDGWAIGIAPASAPKHSARRLFFESGGVSVNSRISLATGVWSMIDVTWNASQVSFYVNAGASTKTVRTPHGWVAPGPVSNHALVVGPGAGANGTSLDEVALFGSVLQNSQISAHYAATLLPTAQSGPTLSPITGVQDRQTLTLTPGAYSGSGVNVSEQWQRCDATNACSTVTDALGHPVTGTSYVLTSADVGYTIDVQETATNAAGSVSVISADTDPVLALAPFVTDRGPSISGAATPGQILTADPGHWDGTPTIGFAYQWRRCDAAGLTCADIPGQSNPTYVVDPGQDVGSTLRVTVTATNGGGSLLASSPVSAVVVSIHAVAAPIPAHPAVATASRCVVSLGSLRAIVARLAKQHLRLALDVNTGNVTLKAPRGHIRSAIFSLDGNRLRTVRRPPFAVTLSPAGLKLGNHLLRATIRPPRGKARTLVLRLRAVDCRSAGLRNAGPAVRVLRWRRGVLTLVVGGVPKGARLLLELKYAAHHTRRVAVVGDRVRLRSARPRAVVLRVFVGKRQQGKAVTAYVH
jgi:hypothetical protein